MVEFSRKGLLFSLSAVTVAAASCNGKKTAAGKNAEKKPMNIVYIMSDDHSYQTISAYDDRFIETPNIDRIAREGVRFTNSFVANSISGPSRACMLTGKHSHANGFTDNSAVFDGGQQTFPKLLQKAGYQTAVIGKWHLTSAPTGFDYSEILIGQGIYYNAPFVRNGEKIASQGYVTNVITDKAIDWLENGRDKSKPFCLLLHHKAPHRTWMPDTCDLDLFDDVTFPLPANFYDDYEGRVAAAEQEYPAQVVLRIGAREVEAVRGVGARKQRRRQAAAAPRSLRDGGLAEGPFEEKLRIFELRTLGKRHVERRDPLPRVEHDKVRRGPRGKLHPQAVGVDRRVAHRNRSLDVQPFASRRAVVPDYLQDPLHYLSYSLISQS